MRDTIHLCQSPYGIGSYVYVDMNGEEQFGYGLWNPENPNDFTPDPECSSKEERARWKKDCKEWNKKISLQPNKSE